MVHGGHMATSELQDLDVGPQLGIISLRSFLRFNKYKYMSGDGLVVLNRPWWPDTINSHPHPHPE